MMKMDATGETLDFLPLKVYSNLVPLNNSIVALLLGD